MTTISVIKLICFILLYGTRTQQECHAENLGSIPHNTPIWEEQVYEGQRIEITCEKYKENPRLPYFAHKKDPLARYSIIGCPSQMFDEWDGKENPKWRNQWKTKANKSNEITYFTEKVIEDMQGYFMCTPGGRQIHLVIKKKQKGPISSERKAFDCQEERTTIKEISNLKQIGKAIHYNSTNDLWPAMSLMEWKITYNALVKDLKYILHNNMEDETANTLIAHEGRAYVLNCPKVKVKIAKEQCYDHTKITDEHENVRYLDENTNFLQSESRKTKCNEKKQPLYYKIAKEFDSLNILRSSGKIFSYAIFDHILTEEIDASYLFNEHSALNLVHLEETSVDRYLGGWLGNFIRLHLTKISLAYVCIYTIISVSVVMIGLYRGLRPWKALALTVSIVKVFLDLKKYVKEAELKNKQYRIKKKETPTNMEQPNNQKDLEVEFTVDTILDSMEQVLQRLEVVELTVFNTQDR